MKFRVVLVWVWITAVLAIGALSLPAQSSLVSTGATWRYLDTGVDQGSAWRTHGHDDSTWPFGPAQLGFSSGPAENDEATFISRTNVLGEPVITYYFRHTFQVATPSAFTNLLVRLQRDDGAVVYLNDAEVFRSNMPTGIVEYSTLALLAQDDGTALFGGPVNPALLVSGQNVIAVEVHQNSTNSSDISFDLELLGNVMFQRPTVAITAPASGTVVGSPVVLLAASAADVDGTIALVEFLEGAQVLGIATAPPYTFTNLSTTPGSHRYTAVATDSTGISSTSAPVTIEIAPWIIPSRSQWRYLDDGSEPPSNWNTTAFNDSGWSNGIAQFGFGEGDEATPIRRFSDLTGTNIVSFYFRKTFDIADLASISSLSLRLLRDDGAIVYLNGTEVFRNNMPSGPVNSTTLAAGVAEDSELRAIRVSPQLLQSGANLIAVEVHQVNLTSSDVSFDLELLPNLSARRPYVTITSPANTATLFGPTNLNITATAGDVDDAITGVTFYVDGYPSGTISSEPYALQLFNQQGNRTLIAVAADASGLLATSAPVTINIARLVPLVSTGAVWRYSDIGGDQGTNWRRTDFDDTAWLSGAGKLGTNDSPTTVIRIRNASNQQINTSYYRHQFNVTPGQSITNLAFRVLRDDGCVAFLNGIEIFRMNMPTGTVTFNTLAPLAVGGSDEFNYYPTNITAALLQEGVNLLALELHQSGGTSDAGFDLSLTGIAVPPANVPPLLVENLGTNIRLSWQGAGFVLQEASQPAGPFTNRPTLLNPSVIPATSTSRFFRLTKP